MGEIVYIAVGCYEFQATLMLEKAKRATTVFRNRFELRKLRQVRKSLEQNANSLAGEGGQLECQPWGLDIYLNIHKGRQAGRHLSLRSHLIPACPQIRRAGCRLGLSQTSIPSFHRQARVVVVGYSQEGGRAVTECDAGGNPWRRHEPERAPLPPQAPGVANQAALPGAPARATDLQTAPASAVSLQGGRLSAISSGESEIGSLVGGWVSG